MKQKLFKEQLLFSKNENTSTNFIYDIGIDNTGFKAYVITQHIYQHFMQTILRCI